jgi:hypothetical protein
MKTHFVSLMIALIFLFGCEEPEINNSECQVAFTSDQSSPGDLSTIANPELPKYPCDYLTAERNGVTWTVRAESYMLEGDTLAIATRGDAQNLSFRFKYSGLGTYEIPAKRTSLVFNADAVYFTLIGGDMLTDVSVLAENARVDLLEYDSTENVVKGTFTFHFVEHRGMSTISLEKGFFSVHLPD